jgi:hypothetical protein
VCYRPLVLGFAKRGVLFFWAAWLTVVTATNVLDAMVAMGALPSSVTFVSRNWRAINTVMDPLAVPRAMQSLLFAGVIAWEALAAGLYWRALARYRGRPLVAEPAALLATVVNLGLWGAFQVLDEVVFAYAPENVHRSIFVSQMVTILVLQLVPSTLPSDQAPPIP